MRLPAATAVPAGGPRINKNTHPLYIYQEVMWLLLYGVLVQLIFGMQKNPENKRSSKKPAGNDRPNISFSSFIALGMRTSKKPTDLFGMLFQPCIKTVFV